MFDTRGPFDSNAINFPKEPGWSKESYPSQITDREEFTPSLRLTDPAIAQLAHVMHLGANPGKWIGIRIGPMDFAPSEELQEFLGLVRRCVRDELYPLEEEMIQNHISCQAMEPKLQQLRAENKARRWWLPQVGEKFGGLGLSVVDHGLLRAKLDKSPLGFYSFTWQATDAGNIEILIEHGNDLQKNAYLQRLLDGEVRSCFSMTEPELAGSNPVHISTREDAAQFEKLCAFLTGIR